MSADLTLILPAFSVSSRHDLHVDCIVLYVWETYYMSWFNVDENHSDLSHTQSVDLGGGIEDALKIIRVGGLLLLFWHHIWNLQGFLPLAWNFHQMAAPCCSQLQAGWSTVLWHRGPVVSRQQRNSSQDPQHCNQLSYHLLQWVTLEFH